MEKKNILKVKIGNLTAELTSDVYDGEILDTKVEIDEGILCWVAGSERTKFVEEINTVISKYRI